LHIEARVFDAPGMTGRAGLVGFRQRMTPTRPAANNNGQNDGMLTSEVIAGMTEN
jgi:hypothetical protein